MNQSSVDYDAPKILRLVSSTLNIPRKQYSRNFALFLTSPSDSNVYRSYRSGIIFIVCILGVFLFVWSFMLIILKLNGKAVGCASGRAFESQRSNDKCKGSVGSQTNGDSKRPTSPLNASELVRGDVNDGDSSYDSSLPSVEEGSYPPTERDDDTIAKTPSPRERRTQMSFFVFGIITLVCIPLIIVYIFKPLVESVTQADECIAESHDIIDEVQSTLGTISLASVSAVNVLQNMTLDFEVICPNVSSSDINSALGVDLASLVDYLSANYTAVALQVSADVSDIGNVVKYYEEILGLVETSFEEADANMWVLPTLLIILSALTALAIAGVFLSWKRESSRKLQRVLSFGLLPLLIIFSLCCWVVAAGSAASTSVMSDACLAGSSMSPNETVGRVIREYGYNSSSPIYEYISAYTTGCQSDDPADVISDLASEIRVVTDAIREGLSKVDAVGRENIDLYCTGGDELTSVLVGARDLAKLLSSVQQSVSSAADSLACRRINVLYDKAVNDIICTNVAGASSWGFILFLSLGISTMAMITLRASWRHKIVEDKIYDESEVDINMFVDEHEEYLEYISRYKHEWEEYQGLSSSTIPEQTAESGSTDSIQHSSSSESGKAVSVQAAAPQPRDDDPSTASEIVSEEGIEQAFDPYNTDTQSEATSTTSGGNISFLSLNDLQSPKDEEESSTPAAAVVIPPMLRQFSHEESDFVDGIPPVSFSDDIADSTDLQNSPTKSSYKMVPSPSSTPTSEKTHFASSAEPSDKSKPSPRDTADVKSLMKALDEIGGEFGTEVTVAPLTSPESLLQRQLSVLASPGSVKFLQEEEPTPTSHVRQQVDRFSTKRRSSRPSTPPRLRPTKIREMAAKFDSHSPHV